MVKIEAIDIYLLLLVCVCVCACELSVASEFSSSNWFIPSSKSLLQSNRHVRDLFFKCDDLRCWFSRILFERDIYATFMRLFVLCLYINPFSKLDILLSRHIKVKYIFIFAFTSKTLFIIAQ